MKNKERLNKNIFLALGFWLIVSILFSFTYTQSPLYEGNQNTKFLHGLARAGLGYLNEDWLANTVDPLPIFSLLVTVTALINEKLFYIEYVLMFGVYVYSLMGIATSLFNAKRNLTKQAVFLALIFTIHSRWLIWWVGKRYGIDLSIFHNGVALQYLLGIEFQTNVFGVLLLLSISLFLQRKYYQAVIWLGVASLVHPAYLFSSAFITIAYILILYWEQMRQLPKGQQMNIHNLWEAAKKPVLMGLLALGMVLPVIIYNQVTLKATSPETWEQAMRILVYERIPHHSLPQAWLGRSAYIQIALVLAGIGIAALRKSRLAVIMLSLFIGASIFTLVQIFTNSLSLAAISPWRVSVLLVPLASVLIATFMAAGIIDLLRLNSAFLQPLFITGALVGIIAFSYSGYQLQQTYGTSFREKRVTEMMDYVRARKQPGELYMIPPKEPDLNDFRLYTGAPTFINWKSHPYKDTDILEWYSRVQTALAFYDAQYSDQEKACQLLDEIVSKYNVTHVVVKRKDAQLNCPDVHPTYQETKFTVFAIDRQ